MKLVECVPNSSEGRDAAVVDAIRKAIASVDAAQVLDVSSDASHNRSVITFVAPLDRAVDAAFAGMKEAAARIDLTKPWASTLASAQRTSCPSRRPGHAKNNGQPGEVLLPWLSVIR